MSSTLTSAGRELADVCLLILPKSAKSPAKSSNGRSIAREPVASTQRDHARRKEKHRSEQRENLGFPTLTVTAAAASAPSQELDDFDENPVEAFGKPHATREAVRRSRRIVVKV